MTNPYLLDLPAVVSFSGGRTSGFMLRQILDAHGGQPEDLYVCFQNTGLEHAGTYAFVERVAKEWDVDIVWLEYVLDGDNQATYRVVTPGTASKNGEPYDRLIEKKSMLSHPMSRMCTANMKLRVLKQYMTDQLGKEVWGNAVGLRADEPKRALAALDKNSPSNKYHDPLMENETPLYRAGVTTAEVMSFWAASPFDLELPLPGSLCSNCVGCHLKGRPLLELLMVEMPEYFDWWIGAEKRIKTKAGAYATFRSDRPNYAAMLATAKNQGQLFPKDIDPEDTIPCMCTD